MGSSHELLVAAQIVPHTNCDSMGTFTAYTIDPWRMRIGKKYSQLEAKASFRSSLGPWLSDARDECIRDPEQCYVAQLHPKKR